MLRSAAGKVMWVGRARMFTLLLAVMVALVLGYATKAYAAPGDLDTSFDTDGKVTIDFAGNGDEGRALALQEDGKIVVAGYAHASFATGVDFALARYNPNGNLDTTFGTGGKVTTPIGLNHDLAHAIAVRADGKIIVAGQADGGNDGGSRGYDFAVARYKADGTLDTTFGGDGIVITDVGGTDIAYDLAVQGNNVLVTGQASGVTESDIALVRYDDNGNLDPTFGSGGVVKTDFFSHSDQGRAVTLQADGKIIVAGYASRPVDPGNTAAYEYDDFALARYNANGTLDDGGASDSTPGDSFDTDGKVTTQFLPGSSEEVQDVAVQEDGKIVAGGGVYNDTTRTTHAALARYDANGALDTTFDTDGKVMIDNFGETYYGKSSALALQADGKIIFAGASANDFALARLNTNGALDTSFDTDGKLTTDFFGTSDNARGVAVQDDGKIVAAGYAHNSSTSSDFALARYYGGSDATPPVVNLTAPANGATVGGIVQLAAEASDNGTVDRVEFFVNGVLVGSDATAPYAVNWNSTSTTSGDTVQIAAQAIDTSNNAATSTAHTVTVDNAGPNGTISINGGATYTTSTAVTLALSANDAGSGVSAMRFSNDGVTWSAWQAFSTSKSWTLTSTNGTKTVRVQYKDGAGNVSATVSDTIILDTIKPTVSGMSPRHASTIRDKTPTIKATVKDNLTNLQKANIKLYVSGKLISPTKYSYSAATDVLTYNSPRLSLGKKTVKIVATDAARNVGTKSWYFKIR